jgi:putative transposase
LKYVYPVRPSTRVRRQGHSGLDIHGGGKGGLHRTRLTLGEWLQESFNPRLRDELFDGEIFYTLAEACIIIESWRRFYNKLRPHGSLGYKPPAPEVFIPTTARAAAPHHQPASSPALAPKPSMH